MKLWEKDVHYLVRGCKREKEIVADTYEDEKGNRLIQYNGLWYEPVYDEKRFRYFIDIVKPL